MASSDKPPELQALIDARDADKDFGWIDDLAALPDIPEGEDDVVAVVIGHRGLEKGGEGSGHRGHHGIPGHRGGSLPRGAVIAPNGTIFYPPEDVEGLMGNFVADMPPEQAKQELIRRYLLGATTGETVEAIWPKSVTGDKINSQMGVGPGQLRRGLEEVGYTKDQAKEIIETATRYGMPTDLDHDKDLYFLLQFAQKDRLWPQDSAARPDYPDVPDAEGYKKLPKPVAERAREFVQAHGLDPFETAWIITPDGQIEASETQHAADHVDLNHLPKDSFAGNWLAHNHPSGSSFSTDDIASTVMNGMNGCIVGSREHRYTLEIHWDKIAQANAGWAISNLLGGMAAIEQGLFQAFKAHIQTAQAGTATLNAMADDADAWHSITRWRMFAQMFPGIVTFSAEDRVQP